MDPNQLPQPGQPVAPAPVPQQPASPGGFNPNQYDFITNPAKKPKKSLMPSGSGSSKKMRIIMVVIGLVVLLILFSLVSSLLSSGEKANVQQLTTVLQQQTEIARVAGAGYVKVSDPTAQNIGAKTNTVILSQRLELLSLVSKQKIKIDEKLIGAGKKAKTDQALKTAEGNGRYDEAYVQALRTDLEEYKKSLKAAFGTTSSQSMKTMLNDDYKEVNLLLEDITGQPQN